VKVASEVKGEYVKGKKKVRGEGGRGSKVASTFERDRTCHREEKP